MLTIMTKPDHAKINDARRILAEILKDEIAKIESSFQTMRDTLNKQIQTANELKNILGEQNDKLVLTADEATKKIATMSGRLDNTVSGLQSVVASDEWKDVESATDRFSETINTLLANISETTQSTKDRTEQINSQINSWIETSNTLRQNMATEFNKNTQQMKELGAESEAMTDCWMDIWKKWIRSVNSQKNN